MYSKINKKVGLGKVGLWWDDTGKGPLSSPCRSPEMTILETEEMVCVASKKEAGITRSQDVFQEQYLSGPIHYLRQGSQTGR